MTEKQISLLKRSWSVVSMVQDQAVEMFCSSLSSMTPEFKDIHYDRIKDKVNEFASVVPMIIEHINTLDQINEQIEFEVLKFVADGAKPEHYAMISEAMLNTLEELMSEQWDLEL